MTANHPVRRLLARICSDETMARVVDPTLGDVRFENGRLTWRGCLALARALTIHVVASLPGALSRLWSDDEHALPRAVVAGTVTTLMLGALLILPPVVEIPAGDRLGPLRTIWLLAPQALGLTLPASLLVAIPVAFRRAARPRRVMVSGLALSIVCAVATIVVINWIMPEANQTWREEVSAHLGRPVHLERGPNELTLHELRERIEDLRLTPGGVRLARSLEHTYQMRLMLAMIAVPLGVLAVAIALSIRGRIMSVLAGIGAMVAYVCILFPLEFAGLGLMRRFEALPPAVVVWGPAVALVIVSSIALRRSMRQAIAISA
jgi:lipopolysaccharide export LptBFGC system permease protein LptF